MKRAVFEAENLCIRYGQRSVIEDMSFVGTTGEQLCLFGPNRAGKSSIVRVMAGIMKPDSGVFRLHAERSETGVCLQFPEHLFYRDSVLNEAESLTRGADSARRALDAVGLTKAAERSPFTLSEGQKRLLVVACLAETSRAIILDEPFAGLDPETGEKLAHILRRSAERGAAVIYTANRRVDSLVADTVVVVPRMENLSDKEAKQ